MLIPGANDLAVLRIRLVRGSHQTTATVEFEYQVGTGGPIPVATCTTSELGIGRGQDALTGVEALHDLPGYLATAIAAGLDLVGGRPAIWLELTRPCGYLALLPWEAWLVPVLQRAVLRLPYFALRPRAAPDALEVVLCATSPVAKFQFDAGESILRLARQIAEAVPRRLTLHLFTDSQFYPYVSQAASKVPVIVHDPGDAGRYALPRRLPEIDDSYEITNPWLLWIRDALHGRSVDVVHFICHGYLSGDRGAMAFASSPLVNTDTEYSRFVRLGQTCSLMTQLGAWSFAVSGPEHNYSQTGLRELGDSVARTGPGYVLVHDARADSEFREAGAAYKFFYQATTSPTLPSQTPTVTCWAHPRQVAGRYPDVTAGTSTGDSLLTEDASSRMFEPQTERLIADEATPAWLASTARVIERAQANWLDIGARSEGAVTSVSPGDAETALRDVTQMLERHVRAERGAPYGEPQS